MMNSGSFPKALVGKKNDKKDTKRIPSQKRGGQESLQALFNQRGRQKATRRG